MMTIEQFAELCHISIEKAAAISYLFSGCGFTEDQMISITNVIIEIMKKD